MKQIDISYSHPKTGSLGLTIVPEDTALATIRNLCRDGFVVYDIGLPKDVHKACCRRMSPTANYCGVCGFGLSAIARA